MESVSNAHINFSKTVLLYPNSAEVVECVCSDRGHIKFLNPLYKSLFNLNF